MIGFQTERKLLPHGVTFYPVPVTQVAISSTRVAVLGKKMRYYFSPRSATIKAPRRNQSRKNHEARGHHRYNLWSARRRLSETGREKCAFRRAPGAYRGTQQGGTECIKQQKYPLTEATTSPPRRRTSHRGADEGMPVRRHWRKLRRNSNLKPHTQRAKNYPAENAGTICATRSKIRLRTKRGGRNL